MLCSLVSGAMGGPVSAERQHELLWELHLSELKHEEQSNVILIGKIEKGTYCHRALLFKVTCLTFDLRPCQLVPLATEHSEAST